MESTFEEAPPVSVEASPDAVLEAVGKAAEMWGGEWQKPAAGGVSGRLMLPVRAGLRWGYVGGELTVEGAPEGSRLVFRAQEERSFLHTRAVVVLALAALGGLAVVLFPFLPQRGELAPLLPVGVVLALAGWFLVVSRLETKGPREFLELVRAVAEEDSP